MDDTESAYQELKQIMANANERTPKLIERNGKGPIKRFAVLDTQIAGVVIQEEPAAQ